MVFAISLITLLIIALIIRIIIARRNGENFIFFSRVRSKNARISNSFFLFSKVDIQTDDEETKE